MGHPDRRKLRERKRKAKAKENMLNRKSLYDVLDLTPQNAVGLMRNPKYEIRLK